VEDGQHLDTVGENDEIDDVSELLQPRGTHIFPHRAMQLGHLLDASKHFRECGKELAFQDLREQFQGDRGLLG